MATRPFPAFDTFIATVGELLGFSDEPDMLDKPIVFGLNLDSLEVLELICYVEEAFGLPIGHDPSRDLRHMTLRDLYARAATEAALAGSRLTEP